MKDIRDELITGTFMIGADGRKEPTCWESYSRKLEKHLTQKQKEAFEAGQEIIEMRVLSRQLPKDWIKYKYPTF